MNVASGSGVKVLFIEDNPIHVGLVKTLLGESRAPVFQLQHAGSLQDGLKLLEAVPVDIILLDLTLPDSEDLDTFNPGPFVCPLDPDRNCHEPG